MDSAGATRDASKGVGHALLTVLILVCAVTACEAPTDLTTDDRTRTEASDFFPLDLGNTWTYRYQHAARWTGFQPTDTGWDGVVALEVVAVDESGGRRVAILEERLEVQKRHVDYIWDGRDYVPREPVYTMTQDTLLFEIVESADGTITHPFLQAAFNRYHDVTADTVVLYVDGLFQSVDREGGDCRGVGELTLVRGQGPAELLYHCADPAVQFSESGSRRLTELVLNR